MINSAGVLRLFGAHRDETIVGYLVDEDGRTVGGPAVSNGVTVDGRGGLSLGLSVLAALPMDSGSLRIYDRSGLIFTVPVEWVEAGWTVSPPTLVLSDV